MNTKIIVIILVVILMCICYNSKEHFAQNENYIDNVNDIFTSDNINELKTNKDKCTEWCNTLTEQFENGTDGLILNCKHQCNNNAQYMVDLLRYQKLIFG